MCLAVPARLLAVSTALSIATIVTSLLVPQTSRVVRLPEVVRREVSDLRADLYLHPDGVRREKSVACSSFSWGKCSGPYPPESGGLATF
jgi:hypothetical protein